MKYQQVRLKAQKLPCPPALLAYNHIAIMAAETFVDDRDDELGS
jgi:hypothetical protein